MEDRQGPLARWLWGRVGGEGICVLTCRICQFPWCRCSHQGQFQATNVISTGSQNSPPIWHRAFTTGPRKCYTKDLNPGHKSRTYLRRLRGLDRMAGVWRDHASVLEQHSRTLLKPCPRRCSQSLYWQPFL